MTKIKRVEKLLRTAIEERLEQGYPLHPNTYGISANGNWHLSKCNDHGRVCAIGAYLLGKPRKGEASEADEEAALYLHLSYSEITDIVQGFDHSSLYGWVPDNRPFVKLGVQLRLDYFEVTDVEG